ncbi:hypothetical protein B484DRAFT_407734 [Ochromonadaceae sp. CCMP2298]|nr:hypothetical protein B484DRAFT_407734 [Ochromonadaceae sp. CCMP2298]
MGNYCSTRVGNWVREQHPECWEEIGEGEEVALAATGTSTTPLERGQCKLTTIKHYTHTEKDIIHTNNPVAPHPTGAPHLGGGDVHMHDTTTAPHLADGRHTSGKGGSASDPPNNQIDTLIYIPETQHPLGVPFLGAVDVRRTKRVSEMLDFGNEEYGIIGDDTNLFPDSSKPLDITEILAAIKMDVQPIANG